MKSLIHTATAIFAASAIIVGCSTKVENVIIPRPNSIEVLSGYYNIADNNVKTEITDANVEGSPEGYELTITPEVVTIKAGDSAGIFYGRQSLNQLIEAYGNRIPAQKIIDAPRFAYRGVHLDVSRHFQGKEFVKKQLKMFASLKLNTFHFHLTDGIGWRIQLDCYPDLVKKTAFKPADYTFYNNDGTFVTEDTPGAKGGYFTKDDIREILALADSLHITVIPEIEMFGHSSEVFEVFPDLTCPVESDNPGGHKSSEFCIGKEKTFEFLETVLAEVIDLFPSQYIHIGGDEASMRNWASCPFCQTRMKAEGLETVQELQSYGISRIEKFVNSKGRTIIGWEEIAKGGLAENAVLMSWRGVSEGQAAAATGHKVIFCPEKYCYIDALQDDPSTQPAAIGNYVPAMMVYSFDPAEGEFEGKENVWGMQCNLWTEFIESPKHAEYMYYPRVFALAEAAWTQPENKNYEDWRDRAILFSAKAVDKGYTVFDLTTEIGPRKGSIEPIDHLAKGCKVTFNTPYSVGRRDTQENGDLILTDGHCGPYVNKYGGWLGFAGVDADFVVDLGKKTSIKEISCSFASFGTRSGYLPTSVDFEGSCDGESYSLLSTVECSAKAENPETPVFFTFTWNGKEKIRYIHIVAHKDDSFQPSQMPGMPAPPQPRKGEKLSEEDQQMQEMMKDMRKGQMFIDEVIVR